MTIRKEKIESIALNIQYIKAGLSNDKSDFANAQWLLGVIESLVENVEALDRARAISERNRLNSGYTKGGH